MGAHQTLQPPVHGRRTEPDEETRMSAHHGQTPAAWTGVTIALVAFLVGGIGLVIDNLPTFFIGLVLLAASPVVGGVMSKMGMGADTR